MDQTKPKVLFEKRQRGGRPLRDTKMGVGESEWEVAVEDGSGSDPNLIRVEREEKSKQLLSRWVNLAISALGSNLSATDVVQLITREVVQTHPPLFTVEGSVHMESSIIENPTSLMDKSLHSSQDLSGIPDFVDQQIPLALNQPNIQACFGMGSGGGHSLPVSDGW